MKYASSIIEIISEDQIAAFSKNQTQFQLKQPIFEISEVNIFEVPETTPQKPIDNNYTELAAKMKKKIAGNKQILVYNFSNISRLHETISAISKTQIGSAFKFILLYEQQKKTSLKITRSTPKKSSCHSGYTTSTNHQQNIFKKQKKRQNMKQGANVIKGWIQFKILIIISESFKEIAKRQRVCRKGDSLGNGNGKGNSDNGKGNSDNGKGNNEFAKRGADGEQNSELFLKNMGQCHHIEQSFIYTVQNIPEYAIQKELSITTPEKFTKKQQFYPSFEIKHKTPQIHKPKQPIPIPLPYAKPPKSKNTIGNIYFDKMIQQKSLKLSISKPILVQNRNSKDRRYLIARTNCYQLPFLSQFQSQFEQQRRSEKKSNLNAVSLDTFLKSSSEVGSDFGQLFRDQFQKIKDFYARNGNTLSTQIKEGQQSHQYLGSYLGIKNSGSKHQKIRKAQFTDGKKLSQATAAGDETNKTEMYYFADRLTTNYNYSANRQANKELFKEHNNQYNLLPSLTPEPTTTRVNNPTITIAAKQSSRHFQQIKSIQSIIDVVNQELAGKEGSSAAYVNTQKQKSNKIQSSSQRPATKRYVSVVGYLQLGKKCSKQRQMRTSGQQSKVEPYQSKKMHEERADRPSSPDQKYQTYTYPNQQPHYTSQAINQCLPPAYSHNHGHKTPAHNYPPASNSHQQLISHHVYELQKKIQSRTRQRTTQQFNKEGFCTLPYSLNQVASEKQIKSNYGLFLEQNNINSPILSSNRKNSNSKLQLEPQSHNYLAERAGKRIESRLASPQPSCIIPKDNPSHNNHNSNSNSNHLKQIKIQHHNNNSKPIAPYSHHPPQPTAYRKQQLDLKDKYTYFSPQNNKQVYSSPHHHVQTQRSQRPERIISKLQYPPQEKVQRASSKVNYNGRPSDLSPNVKYNQRPQRIISKVQYSNNQYANNHYHQSPEPHRSIQVENNYFIKTERQSKPENNPINYNNNYYTTTTNKPQPTLFHQPTHSKHIPNHFNPHHNLHPYPHHPHLNQFPERPVSKLVLGQKQVTRRVTRPPSCRQRDEGVMPLSSYSGVDSQLCQNKRSHNSSRHGSELVRPRSTNDKIQMTLRRQR